MSIDDTYIFINDYFDYKETIISLEEKNKILEERIKNLELVLTKCTNKNVFTKVLNTCNNAYEYYEKLKMMSIFILFIFGHNPYLIKYIYQALKYIVS